jgi:uncharacterized membrane protein (DUF485 family)
MDDEQIPQPFRSGKDQEFLQQVHQFQYLSYGLIFFTFLGFAGLLAFSETFRSFFIFGASITQTLLAILRIVLGLTAIFLVGMWIAATFAELLLWIDNLQVVLATYHVYLAIILTAVGLGVMLLMVWNIVLFSGYFSLFLLFCYWSQWLANDYFANALAETPLTPDNSKVLEALETYWLKRPQLARIMTMMFISLVAFAISLTGHFGAQNKREVLDLVAYGLMILNILCGEAIIISWRSSRDAAIARAKPGRVHKPRRQGHHRDLPKKS